MSLYDHHLSLSVLLASVSVDSLPVTFQNGCHIMILLPPSGGNWKHFNMADFYDTSASIWLKLSEL